MFRILFLAVLTVAVPSAAHAKVFDPQQAADARPGAAPQSADGWVSLFDGETLAGWTQRNGTATYRIEGDAIVGKTTEGSPNSFLCTDREYADFELLFSVKVDSRLNSGVQIRSQTRGGPTGRVNGPQVEIEASGGQGAEAGYLYGEAAGGWMTPQAQRAPHKHFLDDEWNDYRVLAVGANIKVWINGAMVSDLDDPAKLESHPRGFIGLQVHSIGKGAGPMEVSWRNLSLREIHRNDGFVDLFNGVDLSGWKTTGNWVVEDDSVLAIRPREGEQGWQRYGDYLWTEAEYGDFVLDLEYSYPKGGNSGVYFRVGDVANPVETGIEVQILDSSAHEGPMTHHDHGGVIRTVGASKNMSKAPGEWNRMVVTCLGSHLRVRLNGELTTDLMLDSSAMSDRPLRGSIGLQDHGRPHDILFRNVRLLDLTPVSLFNGEDLSGWHSDIPAADGGKEVPPSFVAENGLLISKGNPQGHLITDASYSNYRLEVQYRWPGEPGNCGVLVHSSTPRRLYKMFPASIECQMHRGNAGDFWCIGENIAVPNMASRRSGPPEKWGGEEGQSRNIRNLTDDSENPKGEWNTMVIECRGRAIDVWVNGDFVNNGFNCTVDRGQIALQAEGAACEFRKVELTPLHSD